MESWAERRNRIKTALVLAHRKRDWEKAKKLSQQYQALKKYHYCIDCGKPISVTTLSRCGMCYCRHRHYSKTLQPIKEEGAPHPEGA
jgi:RNA polymerase-binding transcription factor DksA